jgi:tRNA threonylcarbamoyladenosine biosynthesis protein TsaB
MLTLGISTSSGQFALVFGENNKLLFNSDELQFSANKDITELMLKGLEVTAKSVRDISNIIVDIGPGGTSRVRTGIAFANSLAYSLGISVCPVSSMELAGLDAWAEFSLPVIATVKSIGGNAYIGFFNNGKLVGIEYGNLKNIVTKFTEGTDEIVVVGYHRDQIREMFPELKITDSGKLFGNARILAEKSDLFLDRAVSFPQYATPITEKTL